MRLPRVLVGLAVLVLFMGCIQSGADTETGAMNDGSMTEDDSMADGSTMDDGMSYSGTVLAGSESPLLEYNQADYDAAIASGKLAVLYFYADWCPICAEEFPKMMDAFDELDGGVVGFRVNYRDDLVTPEEEQLAREYGISYQHTKVFVKDGERLLKTQETWSKQDYLDNVGDYL